MLVVCSWSFYKVTKARVVTAKSHPMCSSILEETHWTVRTLTPGRPLAKLLETTRDHLIDKYDSRSTYTTKLPSKMVRFNSMGYDLTIVPGTHSLLIRSHCGPWQKLRRRGTD